MDENSIIRPMELLESEQTNELATALAKAQAEFEVPHFDGYGNFKSPTNPQGNPFCTLTSLTVATRKALSKYGLSVETKVVSDENTDYHYTILRHSSGQWSKSKVRITQDKVGLHGFAAANTYLTRIGYGNAVGAARGEYDDDAGDGKVETHKPDPKKEPIMSFQLSKLLTLNEEDQQRVLMGYKIKDLQDLNIGQYEYIVKKFDLK
jgi:hypothetical protein